ncbi:MAG: hypothetical protein FD180_2009 [Planctomycetota bacterium]|nr:MAG: hypothetical protein FD180_2009 [Planctomycetota bacterium]
MEISKKANRCDVCRRREAGNTWTVLTGEAVVRERRICDVCIRVRAALARTRTCANCGKKNARRFRLRFSPGGMSLAVHLCRQCWSKQAVVDRIHRKIKGVVKRRGENDEATLQRDIERFLRRQDGDLN